MVKKELLGHLVDSATNNHQRFVRGQFEEVPEIYYEQDHWNRIQDYQSESREQLINFWEVYNRHLAHVISKISQENLQLKCKGKDKKVFSLAFLIEDYLHHLEYHLKQIVDY